MNGIPLRDDGLEYIRHEDFPFALPELDSDFDWRETAPSEDAREATGDAREDPGRGAKIPRRAETESANMGFIHEYRTVGGIDVVFDDRPPKLKNAAASETFGGRRAKRESNPGKKRKRKKPEHP